MDLDLFQLFLIFITYSCFIHAKLLFWACRSSGLSLTKKTEKISNQPECSELQLPDASLLLDSPAFSSHLVTDSDHSSRVGAAMAENASRKRALNCSPASHVRSKVPKGTLPPPKNVPDTVGGHLLPPQLTGRCVLNVDYC